MGGGTEAFPDLGMHCQLSDCRQLDFLPFKCDGCNKVFCVEHRSYKSHECPKSDHNSRKVVVCETCSISIETTGREGEDENAILEKHERTGDCNPKKKKKKPTCAVRRCKEIFTFSNTCTCKSCQIKVCLKHRFPADHACNSKLTSPTATQFSKETNKLLVALASRNGQDCTKKGRNSSSLASSSSVKAY